MMNYNFKTLSDTLERIGLPVEDIRAQKLVHFYTSSFGRIPIDPPVMAGEFECPFCGSKEFFRIIEDNKGLWMCGLNCSPSRLPNNTGRPKTQVMPKRALEWALLCEMSGIGDRNLDVTFEKIEQSPQKIEFLSSYTVNPQGILIMEGDPGTGKTYACLGMCELYSRASTSVMFLTQKTMTDRWLDSFREERGHLFQRKLEDVQLLVIDDFATGSPSPAFLTFFMEVVNSRMQWTNKGTVITTNLNFNDLSKFCGHALADRLRIGQRLLFQGTSRRKKVTYG